MRTVLGLLAFMAGYMLLNALMWASDAAIDAAPDWLLTTLGSALLLAMPFGLYKLATWIIKRNG